MHHGRANSNLKLGGNWDALEPVPEHVDVRRRLARDEREVHEDERTHASEHGPVLRDINREGTAYVVDGKGGHLLHEANEETRRVDQIRLERVVGLLHARRDGARGLG